MIAAFGGKKPALPMLSRDGTTAAVAIETSRGDSGMYTILRDQVVQGGNDLIAACGELAAALVQIIDANGGQPRHEQHVRRVDGHRRVPTRLRTDLS